MNKLNNLDNDIFRLGFMLIARHMIEHRMSVGIRGEMSFKDDDGNDYEFEYQINKIA